MFKKSRLVIATVQGVVATAGVALSLLGAIAKLVEFQLLGISLIGFAVVVILLVIVSKLEEITH